jgi:hypothetical protein
LSVVSCRLSVVGCRLSVNDAVQMAPATRIGIF